MSLLGCWVRSADDVIALTANGTVGSPQAGRGSLR